MGWGKRVWLRHPLSLRLCAPEVGWAGQHCAVTSCFGEWGTCSHVQSKGQPNPSKHLNCLLETVLQKRALVIYGEMHAALRVCFLSQRISHPITLHNLLLATAGNESSYTNQSRGDGLQACLLPWTGCGRVCKTTFHNSDYFVSVQGIGYSC